MHGAWFILRWAWSAVVIAYLLLYMIAAKRLSTQPKKRSDAAFWVIVVLVALRIGTRFVLGGGLVYRVQVLFDGMAAGFALLDLIRMLLTQQNGVRANATSDDDRIQPLKLS